MFGITHKSARYSAKPNEAALSALAQDGERTRLPILVFIAFLAILPQIYKFTLPTYELFAGFISDDAFYYYKTARNFVTDFSFTFDHENVTNGFHPLWMVFCVIVAFFSQDPHQFLFLALALNLLITLLFTMAAFRLFERELGFFFSCFLVFLMNWIYKSGIAYFSGLETPLGLLLLCLSILALKEKEIQSPKNSALIGLLLGLTVLARTEYLLFLPVAFGFMFFRLKQEAPGLKAAPPLTALAVVTLIIGPYFILNYINTGHFEQVSGLVKSADTAMTWKRWSECSRTFLYYPLQIVNGIYDRPARINLALSAFIIVGLFNRGYRRSTGLIHDRAVLTLCALVALILLHHGMSFGPCQFRDWHAAAPIFLLQVVWVHLLKDMYLYLTGVMKKIFSGLLIIFLMSAFIQVPYFASHWRSTNYHFVCPRYYRHEATQWIRENLPEKARIGAWNSGYLGYFSGRTVINLDGYINGLELYEYLTDGRGVWKYIIDNRIEYIADYFWGAPFPESSEIGARLELVKSFGKCETPKGGKPSYVDFYIWKVNSHK
jgi:hypothetical protein